MRICVVVVWKCYRKCKFEFLVSVTPPHTLAKPSDGQRVIAFSPRWSFWSTFFFYLFFFLVCIIEKSLNQNIRNKRSIGLRTTQILDLALATKYFSNCPGWLFKARPYFYGKSDFLFLFFLLFFFLNGFLMFWYLVLSLPLEQTMKGVVEKSNIRGGIAPNKV